MSNEQQRHDISDKVWNLLELHLLGQRGQWGGIVNITKRTEDITVLQILINILLDIAEKNNCDEFVKKRSKMLLTL